MKQKEFLVFHPDIYRHNTNNEYTKKIYSILNSEYEVKSFEWFLTHPFSKNIKAIYLNWFENTIGNDRLFIQKFQYAIKLLVLWFAHIRKIRICYVIHNKTPHSISETSLIYRKASKKFIQKALNLSDRIIELCVSTEKYLSEEFSVKDLSVKIRLVPHGNYTKYTCDRNELLKKYGLGKEDFVLAYVGKMDKYKNIDLIIKAFYKADIQGFLLIVGKIEPEYEKEIKKTITDNRVITDFSYVSDENMSGIMQIADAIVLPYDKTSINSGIMINSFSNGTTVIGTNIEMLQDYEGDLVYGYTYYNKKDHINKIAREIKKAETDGKIILDNKGKQLEECVNRNNNWTLVRKCLLRAINN